MTANDPLESMLRKLRYRVADERRQETLANIFSVMDESHEQTPTTSRPQIWRLTMNTRTGRFALAAAVILIVLGGITFWPFVGKNGKWTGGSLTAFAQDAFLMWEPDDSNPTLGYGYNDGSSFPDPTIDGGLGRRHGKTGGIVLAFDSHVEFIKYDVWKRESELPTKNRMYCSPGSANGR